MPAIRVKTGKIGEKLTTMARAHRIFGKVRCTCGRKANPRTGLCVGCEQVEYDLADISMARAAR